MWLSCTIIGRNIIHSTGSRLWTQRKVGFITEACILCLLFVISSLRPGEVQKASDGPTSYTALERELKCYPLLRFALYISGGLKRLRDQFEIFLPTPSWSHYPLQTSSKPSAVSPHLSPAQIRQLGSWGGVIAEGRCLERIKKMKEGRGEFWAFN